MKITCKSGSFEKINHSLEMLKRRILSTNITADIGKKH
jgi:hypothetical protein